MCHLSSGPHPDLPLPLEVLVIAPDPVAGQAECRSDERDIGFIDRTHDGFRFTQWTPNLPRWHDPEVGHKNNEVSPNVFADPAKSQTSLGDIQLPLLNPVLRKK